MSSSLISSEPGAAAPPEKATGHVDAGAGGVNGSDTKHAEPRFGTSMIKSKFLTHPQDIGVVAVGFSGGQVRHLLLVCLQSRAFLLGIAMSLTRM